MNNDASVPVRKTYVIEVNNKKDKQPQKVVVEVVKRPKKSVNS